MHVHSSQLKMLCSFQSGNSLQDETYEDGEFVTEFDRRRFVSCFQNLRSSELSFSGFSQTIPIEFDAEKMRATNGRRKAEEREAYRRYKSVRMVTITS